VHPIHVVLEAVNIPVAVLEHLSKQISEFRLPPQGLLKSISAPANRKNKV
jgi:hypothetical protein